MAPRFTFSRAMYRLLLSLLPASFRRRFGPDMEDDFAELMAAKTAEQPIAGRVRGWRVAVADLARTSSRERAHATLAAIRLDVKEAARRLVRTPAFTLGVVATLGVGLAVATLTFAIVDGVWLRPFPYLDPDRVVMVSRYGLTTDELASIRAERGIFTDLGGYNVSFAPLTLLGDEPQMLRQALVTPNFLEVLGVRPALGQPRFDDPGTGDREVMLSHRLWTQRFGSDPAIVGRRVAFEDGPRQVVGVLAPDFFFPTPIQALMPDVLTVLDAATPKPDRWIRGIGRLQPGVTAARASAVVDAIVQRPDIPAWRLRPPSALSVRSLTDETVGDYVRNMMALLFGGVGVLLLIASLNLMHMLVARGLGRAREVAVRRALGARRVELVRLFLLEALMLAAAGGVLGWLLSLWTFDFVRALVPAALVRGSIRHAQCPRLDRIRWLRSRRRCALRPVSGAPAVARESRRPARTAQPRRLGAVAARQAAHRARNRPGGRARRRRQPDDEQLPASEPGGSGLPARSPAPGTPEVAIRDERSRRPRLR